MTGWMIDMSFSPPFIQKVDIDHPFDFIVNEAIF